ncbi:hypothetical protein C2G38_2231973 [Gigaspora rosea]|uniref:Uncharacterized protein n=1 Tax=Gigaspora rosea TaxID=44941 RepID=A0A397U102_9GLOM|nr:hypothetical protein C2G38_2231973 [Gigaspora rosea]
MSCSQSNSWKSHVDYSRCSRMRYPNLENRQTELEKTHMPMMKNMPNEQNTFNNSNNKYQYQKAVLRISKNTNNKKYTK